MSIRLLLIVLSLAFSISADPALNSGQAIEPLAIVLKHIPEIYDIYRNVGRSKQQEIRGLIKSLNSTK